MRFLPVAAVGRFRLSRPAGWRGGCGGRLPAAGKRDHDRSAGRHQFEPGGAEGQLPAGERHQHRTAGTAGRSSTAPTPDCASASRNASSSWSTSRPISTSSRAAATPVSPTSTPAMKWQISPVPGKIDLSATVGVGLPTGTRAIAGWAPSPMCSFRGRGSCRGGWGLSGMLTNFFSPPNPSTRSRRETTFVIEREFGKKTFAFVEYVGDYREHGGPSYMINSGAGYRVTNTQQIDFHVAIGLNDIAPVLHHRHRLLVPLRQSVLTSPSGRAAHRSPPIERDLPMRPFPTAWPRCILPAMRRTSVAPRRLKDERCTRRRRPFCMSKSSTGRNP